LFLAENLACALMLKNSPAATIIIITIELVLKNFIALIFVVIEL